MAALKALGPMQLSVPELDCAYRHAIAVYGDIEQSESREDGHGSVVER